MDWQVEEEKGRACLRASRPDDGRGLYRAWVRGPMARCLLGTMAPSGERLTLRRVLPVAELRAKGCWPVVAVEEELSFPFRRGGSSPAEKLPTGWRRPQGLEFPDPLIARAFRESYGAIYREAPEGGFTLAYLYSAARPFPLVPLFCLARLEPMEGKDYLLFSFGRKNEPVLPHNPSACGDTTLKP